MKSKQEAIDAEPSPQDRMHPFVKDVSTAAKAGLGLIGFWACVFLFAVGFSVQGLGATAGQVGDAMNVATSLFSALAIAGVAYSLILQSAEIRSTRESQSNQMEALAEDRFNAALDVAIERAQRKLELIVVTSHQGLVIRGEAALNEKLRVFNAEIRVDLGINPDHWNQRSMDQWLGEAINQHNSIRTWIESIVIAAGVVEKHCGLDAPPILDFGVWQDGLPPATPLNILASSLGHGETLWLYLACIAEHPKSDLLRAVADAGPHATLAKRAADGALSEWSKTAGQV